MRLFFVNIFRQEIRFPYTQIWENARVKRAARANPGLTLSEVVIALAILTFVALMVIGIFTALLKASAKNREQAMAELLTDALLERAVARGPSDWGVGGQTAQRLSSRPDQDGTEFFYQVDPVFLHSESANSVGALYRVDVVVGWWTEAGEALENSRTGFGNRFVKGSRTTYVGGNL